MRVIVCGSRHWRNERQLYGRLLELPAAAVLVHGACPDGVDFFASGYWVCWLRRVAEPHPADWAKYGNRAGPIRNSEMAKLGADLCIAFRAAGKSDGTDDMIKKAKRAGIPRDVIHEEVSP